METQMREDGQMRLGYASPITIHSRIGVGSVLLVASGDDLDKSPNATKSAVQEQGNANTNNGYGNENWEISWN